MEKLAGHVIVCGLGRNGRQVVDRLLSYKAQVVIIEQDAERAERFREEFAGALLIIGDATADEILEKANIAKASSLIAALASDTDNLFVVISARQLNPRLKIGARANTESTEKTPPGATTPSVQTWSVGHTWRIT